MGMCRQMTHVTHADDDGVSSIDEIETVDDVREYCENHDGFETKIRGDSFIRYLCEDRVSQQLRDAVKDVDGVVGLQYHVHVDR